MRGLLITSLFALVALLAAAPGALAQVRPFGVLDCKLAQGVRFCPGNVDNRIKSFDGVPLDVNVALPADDERLLPLVIDLSSWGGAKRKLGGVKEWAADGYAVLTISQRGFGDSCGSPESRAADPEGCARGWTHLADSRYEARDAQHLAGLLADQGIVSPRRIGVTGNSYGAVVALTLAALRDSVRLEDGSFVAWRSTERRLAMSISAAAANSGWSGLVYSLIPNGRHLDYAVPQPMEEVTPRGILKESYWRWLYAPAPDTYYAPFGVDPSADMEGWDQAFSQGESADPALLAPIFDELRAFHGPNYLADGVAPAPLFLGGGFTDDLVPADEQLAFVNRHPDGIVSQFYGDVGHPRAQKKPADLALRKLLLRQWFERHLKGDTTLPPPDGVTAFVQTCPSTAPSGGPFTASSWAVLHPGEVRFRKPDSKLVLSTEDALGPSFDPLGGVTACSTADATDQDGTASYRLPPASPPGYTLLGSPTVIADLALPDTPAPDQTEVAARLWDVGPDGQQTLVARGLYRPSGSGQAVFQLHPNGWRFEEGHSPKLELLGSDSPYGRLSDFDFSLGVSNLELRLPTAEGPNSTDIEAPLTPVLPPGAIPAP
jgi:dienelactone hydrolase